MPQFKVFFMNHCETVIGRAYCSYIKHYETLKEGGTMKLTAAALALLIGFTAGGVTVNTAAAPAPAASPTPAAVQHLKEDEAGWDCQTMGNGECEPADTAEEVPWPPVDNQHDALVQCFLYLAAGADQDACTAAAFVAFPVDMRPVNV